MSVAEAEQQDEQTATMPAGWRMLRLGEICREDRQIVEPHSAEARRRPYVGLEDIESESGRLLRDPTAVTSANGVSTSFAFDSRHVLYGKLRPYLNKVASLSFEGRCSTELIPLLPLGVDRDFLHCLLRRKETVAAAMKEKTGSRMPRADMDDLLRLLVPLPPIEEQRRIAAVLRDRMQSVERARCAADVQLRAVRRLPIAELQALLDALAQFPTRPLPELADFLPARSIATDGDAEVTTITTACLSELFFDAAGLKRARMHSHDVADCIVRPGEVLIARSNTPELVGRATLFTGTPSPVVASDLTIRLWARTGINPAYLARFFSCRFVTGYWKERAGGASGSMKKITRGHLRTELVPVPPEAEQGRFADQVASRLRSAQRLLSSLTEQDDAINRLPAALLRAAFSGRL